MKVPATVGMKDSLTNAVAGDVCTSVLSIDDAAAGEIMARPEPDTTPAVTMSRATNLERNERIESPKKRAGTSAAWLAGKYHAESKKRSRTDTGRHPGTLIQPCYVVAMGTNIIAELGRATDGWIVELTNQFLVSGLT